MALPTNWWCQKGWGGCLGDCLSDFKLSVLDRESTAISQNQSFSTTGTTPEKHFKHNYIDVTGYYLLS